MQIFLDQVWIPLVELALISAIFNALRTGN